MNKRTECEGCEECIYICEGDFICTRVDPPVMIIEGFSPTDNYLRCQKVGEGA